MAGLKVMYFKNCTVLHHWQRISKKKFFSKHSFEHLKCLKYYYRKYKKTKLNQIVKEACQNK